MQRGRGGGEGRGETRTAQRLVAPCCVHSEDREGRAPAAEGTEVECMCVCVCVCRRGEGGGDKHWPLVTRALPPVLGYNSAVTALSPTSFSLSLSQRPPPSPVPN